MAEVRDRPDVELFAEIGRIDQLFRSRVEGVLPHRLTASQFALLNRLARSATDASPAALAAEFRLTKGAITNTLQRLEAAAFVAVRAVPGDARRKAVTLTDAGRSAHAAAVAAVRPQMEALRSAFAAEEIESALPFLRALRAWLEPHRS